MTDLIEFSWWGSDNAPPENFKTKKQLSELGLSPKKARGVIHTNKYDLLLYDITDNESVKPKRVLTEKQLTALEKGREKQMFNNFLRDNYFQLKRQINFIEMVKDIIYNHKSFLIVQTATTGLEYPFICEISIINQDGKILFDSLIDPCSEFDSGAIHYHGITPEMVNNKPNFKNIYPQLKSIIENKLIFSWNDFHKGAINFNCRKFMLDKINFSFEDLQWIYSCIDFPWLDITGEGYSYLYKLESNHRATDTALKALEKMREISLIPTPNVIDDYNSKSKIDRELLIKWYREKYPNDVIYNTPKDTDVMLGNCHFCPDDFSVMLSPNSK